MTIYDVKSRENSRQSGTINEFINGVVYMLRAPSGRAFLLTKYLNYYRAARGPGGEGARLGAKLRRNFRTRTIFRPIATILRKITNGKRIKNRLIRFGNFKRLNV